MTDASLDVAAVEAALADFSDPETGRSAHKLGQIDNLQLEGNRLSLRLALTPHSSPLRDETRDKLRDLLAERLPALETIDIELALHERPVEKIGQIGLAATSVIAVASGKGGVGKSTIATTLALGLSKMGCRVGLMDADVYGPSVPHLLGVNRRPEVIEKKIQPIETEGLKVMSMGFLVPPEEAIVWRGPMLHGAITQFLRDTEWGELDYLIIDMPPGTGDIALTLSQLLPLTGSVIVCTPQDVALADAIKAIAMYRKVNIPILGVVENMSYFLCPDNGKRYEIFGNGGAKARAEKEQVPFLGELPINMQIRIHGDQGATSADLEEETTAEYLETICRNLARSLAESNQEKPALPSLSVL